MAIDAPIGIFDSGFGGLTVARALIDLLPNEDTVYIGDTGRYPYGSKPLEAVGEYAHEIATSLVDDYGVKALVIACNTATAAAYEDLRDAFDVPVIDVIGPGAHALVHTTASGRVGVIGTVGTIESGAYPVAVANTGAPVHLTTAACPGFVEFVERGQTSGAEVQLLAQRLLAPVVAADVDALLLGCTHYPFLARVIGDVVGVDVTLVSSADETAFWAADELRSLGLLRDEQVERSGRHRFLSSGDVDWFEQLGRRLLGPELSDVERWSGGGHVRRIHGA